MLQILLKQKNVYLDLFPNTKIRFEINNPFFVLDYVLGSFSYPFELPNTPTNREHLDFPEYLENTNIFQSKQEITFFVGGVNWFEGILNITKAQETSISVNISLDYGTISLNDEQSLRELNLGEYEFQSEISGADNLFFINDLDLIQEYATLKIQINFKENGTTTASHFAYTPYVFADIVQEIIDQINAEQRYLATLESNRIKLTPYNPVLDSVALRLEIFYIEEADGGGEFVFHQANSDFIRTITTQELNVVNTTDFVFPTIINTNYYRQKNADYVGVLNFYDKVNNLYPYNPNAPIKNFYTLVPMLFLKNVFTKVLELAGFSFEDNFFDAELSTLIIESVSNIDKQHPLLITPYNVMQGRIIFANCVPDISVKTFLNLVQKLFCTMLTFNYKTKTATLKKRKDVLLSNFDEDWSEKLRPIGVEIDEKKNVLLGYKDGVNYLKNQVYFFESVKIGEFQKTENLQSEAGTLKYNLTTFQTEDEKEGSGEMFDLGTRNFPLRFLFWRGFIDEYPTATASDLNENPAYNYTLHWEGEKGLYNKFWKEYVSYLQKNKQSTEQKIHLSLVDLINFDITKKKRFFGNDYLIKKMSIELGNKEDSLTQEATITIVRIG